jgi:hypothetical protein
MSSWGVLLAFSGFSYSVPEGRLGFAPAIRPEDFRSFWSLGSTWGTYEQRIGQDGVFTGEIKVEQGDFKLKEFDLEIPGSSAGKKIKAVECQLDGKRVGAGYKQAGAKIKIKPGQHLNLQAGKSFVVAIRN